MTVPYISAGDPFVPRAEAHNLFLDTARRVFGEKQYTRAEPEPWNEFVYRYAKATSAISPGSFESPTTGTANIWEYDEDSVADPIPLIVATDSDKLGVTVVNYLAVTITSGTQLVLRRAREDTWEIMWADC